MADVAILERGPLQARPTLKERFISPDEEAHAKNIAGNFQKLRFRDAEAYNSARDGDPVLSDAAPVVAPKEAAAPSAAAARMAQYTPLAMPEGKHELFGDVIYKDGVLQETASPAAVASVAAPAAPIAEEEDTVPTRRTMDTLRRPAAKEEQEVAAATGIRSMLSTKTKAALAAVVAAIVFVFVLICVNSSIIRSINSDIASKQAQLAELTQATREVQDQIAELTSPQSLAEWAQDNGMTLGQ